MIADNSPRDNTIHDNPGFQMSNPTHVGEAQKDHVSFEMEKPISKISILVVKKKAVTYAQP